MYKDNIQDNTLRDAWIEVDLAKLDYNIKQIRNKVTAERKITGIIKADAYGHGAVKVASVLKRNGISSFGVATVNEAVELRDAGFTDEEILVLGLTPESSDDTIINRCITPVAGSYATAKRLSDAAAKYDKSIYGYIAVDTGMGRIGFKYNDEDAIEEIKRISELSNFRIAGLFSHFAKADAADKSYAEFQLTNYLDFYKKIQDAGVVVPLRTFANSAAIMEFEEAHMDMVRPGIILYGCYPSNEMDREKFQIKPVMSVKARIVNLKTVPAGTAVSYGCSFIAKRESKIATIPLGYADGFPRPYSGNGKVIVNGVKVPIAGNINMDQCMIDVTDAGDVKEGDTVTIVGQQGDQEIFAETIAEETGTISYEILCAFGQRLPKVYL